MMVDVPYAISQNRTYLTTAIHMAFVSCVTRYFVLIVFKHGLLRKYKEGITRNSNKSRSNVTRKSARIIILCKIYRTFLRHLLKGF